MKTDIKFDRKFLHLGPTKLTRIPEKWIDHTRTTLKKYDTFYGMNFNEEENEEFNNLILMYHKALDVIIKKVSTRIEKES